MELFLSTNVNQSNSELLISGSDIIENLIGKKRFSFNTAKKTILFQFGLLKKQEKTFIVRQNCLTFKAKAHLVQLQGEAPQEN